jgi:hypothetical protein
LAGEMTGCCGADRPRLPGLPPYRRVNRTALGAAALILPGPVGVGPSMVAPSAILLGPPAWGVSAALALATGTNLGLYYA